jgi:hypothetical protein
MKRLIGLLTALLAVAFLATALSGSAMAGTYQAGTPNPPAGYTQTYAHNFVTQGWGDWTVCVDCGGAVHPTPSIADYTKPGAEFGLGIKLTAENQWGEVWSAGADVGPNSFTKALVYIPKASNGETANWPAWWTTQRPWPVNGEIDALEGEGGATTFGTHYGPTAAQEVNSAGGTASPNSIATGWVTVSFLRTGGKVTTWYGTHKIGTANLPVNSGERLVFQNRSYESTQCPSCFGPFVPATAYVSRVTVWSKG